MEQSYPTIRLPRFDKKYKTVIRLDYGPNLNYLETLEWINTHSKDSVDVSVVGEGAGNGYISIYYAFESSDDALVFKIKYST